MPEQTKQIQRAIITSIKLTKETKKRLEHLREYSESYDELINKALNILNICLNKPVLASQILRDIEDSKKRRLMLEDSFKSITPKQTETKYRAQGRTNITDNMLANASRMRKNVRNIRKS